MRPRVPRPAAIVVPTMLALVTLAGCSVQSKKGDRGDKDVAISTPLGGMSVKTDSASVQAKLGLPLYPGATPERKENDNNSSADVNMNFGAFHLRVLAMGFHSTDSPDKVRAYYRGALAQYSDVIECRDKHPVGSVTKTGLGLTCSDDNHVHAGDADSGNSKETELKAGSPARQHIVSFQAEGAGTRFGLVSLELPHSSDKGA